MKRLPLLLAAAILLTGCARTAETPTLTPIAINPDASAVLSAADGYRMPETQLTRSLQCRMLLPQAMGWFRRDDRAELFCDTSGQNRISLEYRDGDEAARCCRSYLHDLGCRLPAGRIQTYPPQTVGVGDYAASRVDARVQEAEEKERLMTYWFIEKPHTEGTRGGCYIVVFDTTAENLDTVMCCIQSFALPDDYKTQEAMFT